MNKKPAKSIMLYMVHFPLIVLVAILALAGVYTVIQNNNSADKSQNVLSSGSGEDGDKNEDEDKDEDEKDQEDEKYEEDEKDEESDDDRNSGSSGSGSSSSGSSSGSGNTRTVNFTNDDDEEDKNEDESKEVELEDEDNDSDELNEVENEIEDEFEQINGKTKSLERVENPNGTISFIKREIENGKVKIEIKTYDANGNLVGESKVEQEGNKKSESNIREFNALGTLLKSFEFKTEDGNELKLKIKEAVSPTLATKVKYDLFEQEIEVDLEDEDEVEESTGSQAQALNTLKIKVKNNKFELRQGGTKVLTNFPITIDPVTGQLFVTTPNGLVELKEMPDVIVQKATANLDTTQSVDLDSIKKLEYKLVGTRSEKLFGLFPITIPVTAYYDAQTGNLVEEQVSFLNKILGIISF